MLIMLLGGVALMASAQNTEMQRAKKIFDLIATAQGDSVYAYFNDNLRTQLTPALFNDTFSQLEKQVGKFKSMGEWHTEAVGSAPLYYCDVAFAMYSLRFIVAFDADGRVNTIRFAPVPSTPKAAPLVSNDLFEESDIEISTGNFKLPGTLTLPKSREAASVVILVHGSGPTDRDETLGPNKPFRDLAWGLAKQGVAVIRYDKRTLVYGVHTALNIENITFDEETVDDALSAIELAKALSTIDSRRIFVLGHSLGAMLAPRIAARANGLAGIILVAGNARPLEDLLLEQTQYISSLQQLSPQTKEMVDLFKAQAANIKRLNTDLYDDTIGLPFNTHQPYWTFANQYKQVEVAKRLVLPVLILQGERDYQVPMTDYQIWRTALSDKKNVQFKSYPTLNHLLQEGSGKSTPKEYQQASDIPLYVIDDMAAFVKQNSLKKE